MTRLSRLVAVGAALAALLPAQANTIAGLDLRLADTWAMDTYVRAGTYPNGRTAVGFWTTCCNPGTVAIPFQAAMNPNHGFIHYLVAREANGRFEQITGWSWVKHTFGSNNDPSNCGSCAGPGRFSWVEVGCSDTYANSQTVDHYLLGPPEEVDPWLGVWVPQCSHFDRGEPPVSGSQLCDGIRSLNTPQAQALNQTLNHQPAVRDADFAVANAQFYWQAGYLVPAEAEANRSDNIGSRDFTPSWNGGSWTIANGNAFVPGTILQRWSGATISSAANGSDDGRFYVAVKVTGPVQGRWHYEYAVHNRDNRRGLGAFRLPICPTAQVWNVGFRDLDQDPLNNWIGAKVGSELVWTTGGNPLRWNALFNFWFDSDAAPVPGSALSLDQFDIGSGAPTVTVLGTAPRGLYDEDLGPGCGSPTTPLLYADGTPNRAVLGNATFALRTVQNPVGVTCAFVMTTTPGTTTLGGGCTMYSAGFGGLLPPFMTVSGLGGDAGMPLAIPSSSALEGIDLDFQAANFQSGGAYLAAFNLSNGLRVRIGTLIANCP